MDSTKSSSNSGLGDDSDRRGLELACVVVTSRPTKSVHARPFEDSSAITPSREIPPAEITALLDHYRHVDPEEAMIPVFQQMQTSTAISRRRC